MAPPSIHAIALPSDKPFAGHDPWLHPQPLRASIHGLAVEAQCGIEALRPDLQCLLADFAVPNWPDGFAPVTGVLLPFSAEAVSRSLSSAAVNISPPDELIELYRDGDRFWVVDDRWGITELHLLKRQWRSWIVPRPRVDPQRLIEMAFIWPLAQLLKLRGLCLVPAASVSKDGWAALILSPFGIEPELRLLLENGYRLIGQRWTALREERGRVSLLQMPGRVERVTRPQRRGVGQPPRCELVDLTQEFPSRSANHAFCDAVLRVKPGRRTESASQPVPPAEAAALLRRCWPTVDLPVGARGAQSSTRLAQVCRCHELQLSRNPVHLLQHLDALRHASQSMTGRDCVERSSTSV